MSGFSPQRRLKIIIHFCVVFAILALYGNNCGSGSSNRGGGGPNAGSTGVTSAPPATPPSLTISLIAAGGGHSCAAVNRGIQCWGDNNLGQLGNGTTTISTTPVQVLTAPGVPLQGTVTSLSAGISHTCAIVDDSLYCWGSGANGRLGISGRTTPSSYALAVPGLSVSAGLTAVHAGGTFTCAVVSGGVMCWGNNIQFALGRTFGVGGPAMDVPGYIQDFPAGSGVTEIRAGEVNVCALAAGALHCWGGNGYGQLGLPAGAGHINAVTFAASGVTTFDVGSSHICATISGASYCAGSNRSCAIGIPASATSSLPAITLATGINAFSGPSSVLRVGTAGSCLITGGEARCVGLGSTLANVVPDGQAYYCDLVPSVALSSNVTAIQMSKVFSSTTGFACAVISGATPSVRCWGDNSSGQLGDGTTTDAISPVAALIRDI